MGTQGDGLIDNLAQILLIGGRGNRTALVDGGSGCLVTYTLIIFIEGYAVHTAILLVVVAEGDDYVVAGLHLLLGGLPKFIVAASGVASALGVVDTGPAIGKELAEIHTPATGHRSRFIVGCHRRVTQCVHLLGVTQQGNGEECQQ